MLIHNFPLNALEEQMVQKTERCYLFHYHKNTFVSDLSFPVNYYNILPQHRRIILCRFNIYFYFALSSVNTEHTK
jgi:hypothetical protein